jgi:hypothetical protein
MQNIYFLVHPGFHVISRKAEQEFNLTIQAKYGIKGTQNTNILKLSKGETVFLKKQFSVYGKVFTGISKNPQNIIVLLSFPFQSIEFKGKWVETIKSMQKRFEKFAEKIVGEKLVLLEVRGSELQHGLKEDRITAVKEKIKSNEVNLFFMGEWEENCLNKTKNAFEKKLKEKGFTVNKSRIISSKSVRNNTEIPSMHQRRAEMQRKKRKNAKKKRTAKRL